MEALVWWLWLVGLVALLGSVVGVGVMTGRYREAWGTRPGPPVRSGESPYRQAETRAQVLRGVPTLVRWAAGTGIAWGVLTLLLFMPSGFLLMIIMGDALGSDVGAVVATILLLLVCCSAVGIGFALMAVGPGVMRGDAEGRRTARAVATLSVVHHLCVFALFVLVTLVDSDMAFTLLISAVPCLLGLAQAAILRQAADLEGNGEEVVVV